MSVAKQFERHLPGYVPWVIFDVGANVGQSQKQYRKEWQEATIYCFEPVLAAYEQLVRASADDDRTLCFDLALGNTDEADVAIRARGTDTANHVLGPADASVRAGRGGAEGEVALAKMRTGDSFCGQRDIARIGLCKIDTEGLDLEVLKGFRHMLSQQCIDFVQVECGMNPTNRKHVRFQQFMEFLEAFGYSLFYIFDQKVNFKNVPVMRRANPMFISGRMVEEYTGSE